MSHKIGPEAHELIRAYLETKHNMPHVVAVYELEQMGIKVSVNTVSKIRIKYELPYKHDKSTYKQVMDLYKAGMDINRELLVRKFPHICNEHVEYILRYYATKKRISRSQKMKLVVSQCDGQLFKFKNVTAHISHRDTYSFTEDDDLLPVRVNTFEHAISQLTQKCA